jgi:hypothetical protein
MNSNTPTLGRALEGAVLRIMRALARVLIRHGLPMPAFAELAKRAYVDVALQDFAIPGRKPSLSRASLLTGLTRKDVQRLVAEREAGVGATPRTDNRAARVVSGWVRDAAFNDGRGAPLELPFDGASPSFSELVRAHGGDVPPRAVLDELLSTGSVVRTDTGRLVLVARAYIPRANDAAKLAILGSDVSLLIGTIDHNLQGLEPARFQRKVAYDNLPVEAVEAFRAIGARHGQALLDELGEWLARHDRDNHPDVPGTGRMRAGVGVFMFEEIVGSDLPVEKHP